VTHVRSRRHRQQILPYSFPTAAFTFFFAGLVKYDHPFPSRDPPIRVMTVAWFDIETAHHKVAEGWFPSEAEC